jgi:hypothetical protein
LVTNVNEAVTRAPDVMTGFVPVIPIGVALPCPLNRDCRDKPGNDELFSTHSRERGNPE